MATQDNIITSIKTGWGLITNAIPSLGANPLASVIYSLLTFGIKTGTQAYTTWKKYILSTPLPVPVIEVPPDSSIIIEYLKSNPAYKNAFNDELSDFASNDILLKKAFTALNQLEHSTALQSAFSHLIETGSYKAFVLSYDRFAHAGSGSNVYDEFRSILKQIEDNINTRSALDEIFNTIAKNVTSDIIDNPDFWKNLKEILR